MSLEALFKNVESIFTPNQYKQEKPEKDPSLKQGRQFLDNEEQYYDMVSPYLALIEETSSPNLGSLVEALNGDDSTKKANAVHMTALSDIEREFNQTLAEYTATYKTFSEDMIQKNQSQKKVGQFFGTTVTDSDNNYVYVNDYGFTHKYSTQAWDNNNKTCPSSSIAIDSADMNLLRIGPDMGTGQPCKIAGKNVQNSETKEVAWIDIQGYKHVYSTDIWDKKEASCDIIPIQVSNSDFNALPEGSNMATTTICDQLDVNPKTWEKLIDLNNHLLELALKLNIKMDDLIVKDVKLQEKIVDKKNEVSEHVNTLKKDRSSLHHVDSRLHTLKGELVDTRLNLRANFYKYLVWIIVMVTVVTITVHNISTNNDSMAANIIVGIFCVVLVYMILQWLIPKF